jgi:glyoxylase-like metal-dependent hydrolase (beta-lactamase superfamily II)
MIVYHFCTSVNEANAYLLIDPESKESLLIDAPEWTPTMQQVLINHDARLSAVFITHEHYDHTSGLSSVLKVYPDIKRFPEQEFFHNPDDARHHTLSLGKWKGKIIHLPGHTPESVGLYIADILFTGDALFAGSVGGTVSPREAKQQIDAIRKNILTLPENTPIFSGHGPATSVQIEKRYNPFLQPNPNP